MLSVPGKAAVSEVDGVALEYALVARRYMGGDAAACLTEIDQPGTRMARSRYAPPGSGSSTSRRGCPRPGRRDRPSPAAQAAGGTACQMPAVPAPTGPDGASPSSLIATVRDYLPAGLSSVLASGTCERYSPEVAALLLGAWAIATLAVGTITLHRRDP